ncbi:hypothetical protein BT69DRAFT_1263975 [Atractiella rhizophila]|nr:hypothetical protein BT69DRAFT_1263975 [Atractiella rhizophila]
MTNANNSRAVTAFLNKLYSMVGDPATDAIIRWSANGDSFIVRQQERLRVEVLPNFFKHAKLESFVRQLNMYGFKKVPQLQHGYPRRGEEDDEALEYSNPFFQRDHPELLSKIERKRAPENPIHTNTVTSSAANSAGTKPVPSSLSRQLSDPKLGRTSLSPSAPAFGSDRLALTHVPSLLSELAAIRKQQLNISAELKELKSSSQGLWQEAISSRDRHKRQNETINKILKFLATVFGGAINAGGASPVNAPASLATPTTVNESVYHFDGDIEHGMDGHHDGEKNPRRATGLNKHGRRVLLLEGGKTTASDGTATSLTDPKPLVESPSTTNGDTPTGQIFQVHDDEEIPVLSAETSQPQNTFSHTAPADDDLFSFGQSTSSFKSGNKGTVARRFTNLDATGSHPIVNTSTSSGSLQNNEFSLPPNFFSQQNTNWDSNFIQSLMNSLNPQEESSQVPSQQIYPVQDSQAPTNDLSMFLSDNPSDYASPNPESGNVEVGTSASAAAAPTSKMDLLPRSSFSFRPNQPFSFLHNEVPTNKAPAAAPAASTSLSPSPVNKILRDTAGLESQVDSVQDQIDKLVENLPIDWGNSSTSAFGNGMNDIPAQENADFDLDAFLQTLQGQNNIMSRDWLGNSWGNDILNGPQDELHELNEFDQLEDNQHWIEDPSASASKKRKMSSGAYESEGIPKHKPRLEVVDD